MVSFIQHQENRMTSTELKLKMRQEIRFIKQHIKSICEETNISYVYCEGCIDCEECFDCKDCNSCEYCIDCVECNDCVECDNCKSCDDSEYCKNSKNCTFCKDCNDCYDCYGCDSLSNKKGWYFNEPRTKNK